MIDTAELDFIRSIDARFPYSDSSKWVPLVETAKNISTNASFAVLHEICRPGISDAPSLAVLEELLALWCDRNQHPLIVTVLPAARALIHRKTLPTSEAIVAMRVIASFPGEHYALLLPYFASDDISGEVESMCNCIEKSWLSSPTGRPQETDCV